MWWQRLQISFHAIFCEREMKIQLLLRNFVGHCLHSWDFRARLESRQKKSKCQTCKCLKNSCDCAGKREFPRHVYSVCIISDVKITLFCQAPKNLCEIFQRLANDPVITISRHMDIGGREINALFSSPPLTTTASASWPDPSGDVWIEKKGEGYRGVRLICNDRVSLFSSHLSRG